MSPSEKTASVQSVVKDNLLAVSGGARLSKGGGYASASESSPRKDPDGQADGAGSQH